MERTKILLADTETLIIFGIITLATIIIATLVGRYLQRIVISKGKDQNIDITSFVFLKHIVVSIIYLFGLGWAFLTLPISKNFAHSLIAGAGVSSLILGFASQHVLSNIMSGVFLIIIRPFKINDTVEFQGIRGKVIEIDLFVTTIEDENKDKVIIPNSMISNGIIKNVYNK